MSAHLPEVRRLRDRASSNLEFSDCIISLSTARLGGLKWYFPGTACVNGHVARRNTINQQCRACAYQQDRAQREDDPDKARVEDRRKYHRNVDHSRARMRAKYARHAEKRRATARRKYRDESEHNAKIKLKSIEWRKRNRGKARELIARRKKQIKMATPSWLSVDQRNQIRGLYIDAASREGEWHIDHIHPLRAKGSCGLHVPWNLQIISGDDNRRKRNLMPEELGDRSVD